MYSYRFWLLSVLGFMVSNEWLGSHSVVQALFEKHKGVNDWHLEMVGEIKDLKFVEDSDFVYTVSKDGLLGLFNTASQEFEWKKRLTTILQQPEEFGLRYLSRNLLVQSTHHTHPRPITRATALAPATAPLWAMGVAMAIAAVTW